MKPVAACLRKAEIAKKALLIESYPPDEIEVGLHVNSPGVEILGGSSHNYRLVRKRFPHGCRYQHVAAEAVRFIAGLRQQFFGYRNAHVSDRQLEDSLPRGAPGSGPKG